MKQLFNRVDKRIWLVILVLILLVVGFLQSGRKPGEDINLSPFRSIREQPVSKPGQVTNDNMDKLTDQVFVGEPGTEEDPAQWGHSVFGEGTPDSDIYINKTKPSVKESEAAVTALSRSLPIYIENFKTSVGITTTINVYHVRGDYAHIIRLEIYGVQYEDNNPNPDTNPEVIAFKESFLEAKKRIQAAGVNPESLQYVFGTRKYIQDTASSWVDKLGLL